MPLSSREVEVLELISLEYTTMEIASKLFVSKETVKSHRKNLLIKMDARNVAGLVRRAFERRLLRLPFDNHATHQHFASNN